MIRLSFGLLLVAVFLVIAIALIGEPGVASLTWLGWQVNTTAAAAILVIGLLAFVATVFWRGVIWLLQSPARARKSAAEARRREGRDALTRGFLAAAAGDGPGARRQAFRAAQYSDEAPELVRLLAARAAEAAQDSAAAQLAYEAMLGFGDMRLAAHRGLMQIALGRGDGEAALRHATAAFGLAESAPWAWQALLENRLGAGDWDGGLALISTALTRKIVSPLIADRARAAFETAKAATLEAATIGDRPSAEAIDLATAAARARPDFTPAAVIAARLRTQEGRGQRAEALIEAAWRARPHPALWRAWRDLRTDETPPARARRLAELALINPDHRESRILQVEQALISGDGAGAQAAARLLEGEPLTRRLAELQARLRLAVGRPSESRDWLARGALAPLEADWSDIGEDGRAFTYSSADWGRVVGAYAERGELLHPRFERGEAAYGELPRIPADYVESQPFNATPWREAAEQGAANAPIFDDDEFGEVLTAGDAAPSTAPPRALGGRSKGR
jgi:HemY protein